MEHGGGRTPDEFYSKLLMSEYFEIKEMYRLKKEAQDREAARAKASRNSSRSKI